jgi:hypothetical protein
MDDDDFFEELEESINEKPFDEPEPVAFKKWEERGHDGFRTKKKSYSDCNHNKKTLSTEARMVQCDDCDAFLDPFDALKRIVSKTEINQRIREDLGKDLEELREKIFLGKKELKSLAGKIKRRK